MRKEEKPMNNIPSYNPEAIETKWQQKWYTEGTFYA